MSDQIFTEKPSSYHHELNDIFPLKNSCQMIEIQVHQQQTFSNHFLSGEKQKTLYFNNIKK